MVHNRYQQRGGEDSVVDAEVGLLAANGVDVRRFDADNDAIHGLRAKIQVSASQLGSPSPMQGKVSKVLAEFRPDIVHVHNWFPTISASVFRICRESKIPVVHTLHNYRLLCVNATLFRNGQVCEDCVGTSFRTPGIIHKCYHESHLGSAVATAGMLTQWALGTWQNSVDRFIALSNFSKQKLIEGGLPPDKILVKPNFVDPDPGPGPGDGGYFLFVGRLTEEKGLRTLLECWRKGPDLPVLRVVGTGPLEKETSLAAADLHNLEWLGSRTGTEVIELMGHASATLCPSLWYEGMPRVVIESFAVGTPVVASNIGCYPEMITDKESGALFPTGDANGLRDRLREMVARNSLIGMRPNARRRFEAEYTGARNLFLTLGIYRAAQFSGDMMASNPVPAGT